MSSPNEKRKILRSFGALDTAEETCIEGFSYFYALNQQKYDRERGRKLILLAAAMGNETAQGSCYYHGWGVSKNVAKAVELFKAGVEKKQALAKGALGNCVQCGIGGVDEDAKRALELYFEAVSNGQGLGEFFIAQCYQFGSGTGVDRTRMYDWVRRGADKGHAASRYRAGLCKYFGDGTERDYKEAYRRFLQAAVQGHLPAQNSVAICYLKGNGITRDYGKALDWLQESARSGYAKAHQSLGDAYRNGLTPNKSRDRRKAAYHYRRAAEGGATLGQFAYADCCARGFGTKKDPSEAAQWYRKAGDAGNTSAMYQLARCYKRGFGVKRDLVVAAFWYTRAAQQGHALAEQKLAKLLRASPKAAAAVKSSSGLFQNIESFKSQDRKAVQASGESQPSSAGPPKTSKDRADGKDSRQDQSAAQTTSPRVEIPDIVLAEEGVSMTLPSACAGLECDIAREKGGTAGEIEGMIREFGSMEALRESLGDSGVWKLAAAFGAERGDTGGNSRSLLAQGVSQWLGTDEKVRNAQNGKNIILLAAITGNKTALGISRFYEWGVDAKQEERLSRQATGLLLTGTMDQETIACSWLGECHRVGAGVTVDRKRASEWYRRGVAQGDSTAQWRLAQLLLTGKNSAEDKNEAVKLLRAAARSGHGPARFLLGACLYYGWVEDSKPRPADALELFRAAALQGIPSALYFLGRCRSSGLCGLERDPYAALTRFREAAGLGSGKARVALGDCYARGYGVSQDLGEALRWYRMAAESGDDPDGIAAQRVGVCALNGWGCPRSEENGKASLQTSSSQGNCDAQLTLGDMARSAGRIHDGKNGRGCVSWYQDAAKGGNTRAMCALGALWESKSPPKSASYYQAGAERGNAEAQFKVAAMYDNPNAEGLPTDAKLAAVWYQKAAKSGHPGAQNAFGWCLENGLGVARDLPAAYEWYRQSAEAGDPMGMYRYGKRLAFGGKSSKSTGKDREAGLAWIKRAAGAGSAIAQRELGARFQRGDGVPCDAQQSAEWFRRAAQQGDTDAQYEFARCLKRGLGVSKDLFKAARWYRLAARQGHAIAQSKLIKLCKRDDNVSKMLALEPELRSGISAPAQSASATSPEGQAEPANSVQVRPMGRTDDRVGRNQGSDFVLSPRAGMTAHFFSFDSAETKKKVPRGSQESNGSLDEVGSDAVGAGEEASTNVVGEVESLALTLGGFDQLAHGIGDQEALSKFVGAYGLLVDEGKDDQVKNMTSKGLELYHGLKNLVIDRRRGRDLLVLGAAFGDDFAAGLCCLRGWGIKPDRDRALMLLGRARDAGNASALCTLGTLAISEGDSKKGASLIQQSVSRGGGQMAVYASARCLSDGLGVPRDLERAVGLFREGAESGCCRSRYALGIAYMRGIGGVAPDAKRAFQLFELAAKQGDPRSQNSLGLFYYEGVVVRADAAEAVHWFGLAAEQGDGAGKTNLGICKYAGKGTPRDRNGAARLFQQASADGNVAAAVNLARCYQDGHGVDADYDRAFALLKEAADSDHASAVYELGCCYNRGQGTPRDKQAAMQMYARAAKLGHALAQKRMDASRWNGAIEQNDNDIDVDSDDERAEPVTLPPLSSSAPQSSSADDRSGADRKHDSKSAGAVVAAPTRRRQRVTKARRVVVMTGWLDKLSPRTVAGQEIWQRRWFVLYADSLAYYKTKDISTSPLGTISFEDVATVMRTGENRDKITVALQNNGRVYVLRAETKSDASAWQRALYRTARPVDAKAVKVVQSRTQDYMLAEKDEKRRQLAISSAPYASMGPSLLDGHRHSASKFSRTAGEISELELLMGRYEDLDQALKGTGGKAALKEIAEPFLSADEVDDAKDVARVSFWSDNPVLMLQDGLAFYYGLNGKRVEVARGRLLILLSAILGNDTARGFCYFKGTAVKKNYESAAACFRRGEEKGEKEALSFIGSLLEDGRGEPQSTSAALQTYQRAAENGSLLSMYELGLRYFNGILVAGDVKKAEEYFLRAANLGDARSRYAVGVLRLHSIPQQVDEAKKWFALAAAQGLPDAMNELGYMNSKGMGSALPDHKGAARLYSGAAAVEHPTAQYNLGCCYMLGNGVEQDQKRAQQMFEFAAESGQPQAQRQMGVLLGRTEAGRTAAVRWLRDAAESGDREAQYRYAECLVRGWGAQKREPKQAVLWYKASAAQGYPGAHRKALYYICHLDDKEGDGRSSDGKTGQGGIPRASSVDDESSSTLREIDVKQWNRIRATAQFDQRSTTFRRSISSMASNFVDFVSKVGSDKLLDLARKYGIQTNEELIGESVIDDGYKYYYGLNFYRIDKEKGMDLIMLSAASGYECALATCYFHGWGFEKDVKKASKWYQSGAKIEQKKALQSLGALYSMGLGVDQDADKARGLYTKAIELGDSTAMYNEGIGRLIGQGYPKDPAMAAKLIERAATNGHCNARFKIGQMYEQGIGVKRDVARAFEFYRAADAQGNPSAPRALGDMYLRGEEGIVERDGKLAIACYRRATWRDDILGMSRLGMCLRLGTGMLTKDPREARFWLALASQVDEPSAFHQLGLIYLHGEGVAQNFDKSQDLFRRAHEKGDVRGTFEYALGIFKGQGKTKTDYKAACQLFRNGAERGDARCVYWYGRMLQNGWGVRRNLKEAVACYKKAASAGLADAEFALGVCYYDAVGVKRSYTDSFVCFSKAAQKGHVEATHCLARAHKRGRGTTKDPHKAAKYYHKAAKIGHALSEQKLAKVLRRNPDVEHPLKK